MFGHSKVVLCIKHVNQLSRNRDGPKDTLLSFLKRLERYVVLIHIYPSGGQLQYFRYARAGVRKNIAKCGNARCCIVRGFEKRTSFLAREVLPAAIVTVDERHGPANFET